MIELINTISHKKNQDADDGPSISSNDDGTSYAIRYKDVDRFVEMDFRNSVIYSKEAHRESVYFVKDSIFNLNWKLDYEDEKKEGSLLRKKATTHFRGRHYTA